MKELSAKALDALGRWRNITVAFRVSPEEDSQIETLVGLSGLTKQDYIMSRLLNRDVVTLKKQLEILLPEHEDGTIHLEATAAKCSEYEKQLEALRDQKQSLFERYLLGQIELDTYKSEKAVYDAEILKVKNAYAAVTAQAKLKREEQARQSSRQEIVHSIAEADVLNSELTDLLIEKVYVFPDNRIEIVYKIHDLFE